MIIENIKCYEVIVPAHPGSIEGKGIHKPLHKLPVGADSGWTKQFDELPKLLLQMTLKNGVVAWGELYRDHNWAMVESISNRLLGMNLNDLCLQKLPFTFCREYDGFETAIWDGFAKSHNMRLVDLLGGQVQDKIKIGAWSSHRPIEEISGLAKTFASQGYDCIKFKSDLEDDIIGMCTHIQDAAPGMKVIIDPNERWMHAFETKNRIDGLQEVGNVLCLEDPIPRWKLDEYAMLRQYGSIPIVLHVSLPYILHGQRIKDAIQAIQAKAVDGFNFNSGLANFQRLDHIAIAAGLPCWHGSEIDFGIMEAMYLHSAAAAESCVWPSDIFGRLIREHDLLKTPLRMEPPYAYLPEGDGIGVEVDMDAIRHYQVQSKEYSI